MIMISAVNLECHLHKDGDSMREWMMSVCVASRHCKKHALSGRRIPVLLSVFARPSVSVSSDTTRIAVMVRKPVTGAGDTALPYPECVEWTSILCKKERAAALSSVTLLASVE